MPSIVAGNRGRSQCPYRATAALSGQLQDSGDDVLLDVIQLWVLPALESAFKLCGVGSVDTLMSQLCGANNVSAAEAVLRQQLNLQVFVPIALALLGRYEHYDPQGLGANMSESLRYGDLVPANNISAAVEAFVQREVQKAGGGSDFTLREVPITFNLARVHQALLSGRFNICKVLAALCEVMAHYHCDMLLLTGRPSLLPGIQAFIRTCLPLPPGRILPLHGYHTGTWYPFHKNGQIDDPKSTASVGP